MRFWGLVIVILGLVLITPRAKAQIVAVPIPGAPGLSIAVGTGVNALPLQNIKDNPAAINITMPDDDWRSVPLQFNFPYFGQQFNRSWMLSNGVVGFRDPAATGVWGMCCAGLNLTTLTDTRYNYNIMPLWTDLIATQGGTHHYLSEPNRMTYGWYGVSEFGTSNRNSFELEINSSGVINTRIGQALVTNRPVTSGMTGDLSKGEYYQYYHGWGWNISAGAGVSWSAPGGTGVDQCVINPLYNSSCPGYADAYKTQQCSISALYDPSCPGYQQAYFDQQCSLNSLYNENCTGYQQAYFTQQCTANSLYNSGCPGYQQAYFSQQCSLSALYDPACPGYATAYQTYLRNQACQANPQSSPTCPGYVGPTVATTTTPTTVVATTTSSSSSTPPVVADPVVNQTITTTSTSTAPTAPAAPVQLVTPAATSTQQTTTALAVESVQSQSSSSSSSSSSSTGSSSSGSSTSTASSAASSSSTTAPTPRQNLQQARLEAARKQAVEKGAEAVKESGEAKSIEQQKATQGLIIAAMGFNPGFDAYNSVVMRDVSFYKPFTIYSGQRTVDNRSAARGLFGGTDRLHNQMVDQQYQLGK